MLACRWHCSVGCWPLTASVRSPACLRMSELLCANVRGKKWLLGLLDGLSLGDDDNGLSLGDDDQLALLCRHLRRPVEALLWQRVH